MRKIQALLFMIILSFGFVVLGSNLVGAQSSIPRSSVIYGPGEANHCIELIYENNKIVEAYSFTGISSTECGSPPNDKAPLSVADLNDPNVVVIAKICIGPPRTDLRNCLGNLEFTEELVFNQNPFGGWGGTAILW